MKQNPHAFSNVMRNAFYFVNAQASSVSYPALLLTLTSTGSPAPLFLSTFCSTALENDDGNAKNCRKNNVITLSGGGISLIDGRFVEYAVT